VITTALVVLYAFDAHRHRPADLPARRHVKAAKLSGITAERLAFLNLREHATRR
jgi:hypothetical protein